MINIRGQLMDLSIPKVMGILNLTPDSFSDGGRFYNTKNALKQAEIMIEEGADIIDVGAQSTRPNAKFLSADVEIERLGKIISTIKKAIPAALISLDTFYSEVVKFGFQEGIDIINDISGGNYDEPLLQTVSETRLPYILMHSNNVYKEMHDRNIEEDIILYLNRYFSFKIAELYSLGIKDVILDPGFGFGKTISQQNQMVEELQFIGFTKEPLLAGISRKSFIYKSVGKSPLEIDAETKKIHLKLLQKGAKILRVHEVKQAKEVIADFLHNKSNS